MAPASTSTVAPEEARRAHSIRSALLEALTSWYPVVAPIAAWTLHLILLTSIVQISCTHPGWLLVMHAATAATLAVTGAAMALSWRLLGRGGDASASTDAGHRRFLGQLGLLLGAANALLIVVEEILVFALESQRCG